MVFITYVRTRSDALMLRDIKIPHLWSSQALSLDIPQQCSSCMSFLRHCRDILELVKRAAVRNAAARAGDWDPIYFTLQHSDQCPVK